MTSQQTSAPTTAHQSNPTKKNTTSRINNVSIILGYIRDIENNVLISKTIIPHEIYQLCIMYCMAKSQLLLLFNSKESLTIYIADIDFKRNDNLQIKDLLQSTDNKSFPAPRTPNIPTFCYKHNVSLPLQIRKLHKNFQMNNVIFSPENAYILDDHDDNSCLYKYKLPQLNYKIYDSSLIFNEKIGLLSIGGSKEFDRFGINHIYRLKWCSYNETYIDNNWKWERLPDFIAARANPTAIYIENEDKILIMGTSLRRNATNEIYDLNTNTSIIFNISSMAVRDGGCGIYDKYNTGRVYIGGGQIFAHHTGGKMIHSAYNVSYFDFNHQDWIIDSFPNTTFCYGRAPILWIDDYNKNLLCIAGMDYMSGKCKMETYDIRSNAHSWNISFDGDNLINVFGINQNVNRDYFPLFLH